MSTHRKASTKDAGNKAEEKAKEWFLAKGFTVLKQNYRFGRNEIDLICSKDNLLVFVEVKYRTKTSYGLPEQQLSEAQKLRIMAAAEQFILETDHKFDVRFDVLSVSDTECIHFEDAFH
jgi:putative endonuclease